MDKSCELPSQEETDYLAYTPTAEGTNETNKFGKVKNLVAEPIRETD